MKYFNLIGKKDVGKRGDINRSLHHLNLKITDII